MSYHVRRIPGAGSLEDAFAVRRAVFIDEQDVDEALEMDGKDEDAVHFVIIDADSDTAAGTARFRVPDDEYGKPERVAVRKEYRGNGLGRRLMALIESEARTQGCQRTRLHAQKQVVEFYRNLGYEVTSDEFEEAGIVHVEMEKPL
ncbi:GNAT family N-acetyltransferase [Halovenus sp. WSH3]|uniref:GNAT family N-acetyltransferase n=1 Tax=Halovenus carboxidivorans TaxID=2692199 RepID=A0A6B0T7I9_9EURY|nr:GNAT family N-acetyltransferase [Halovenus carboxidivorans]MXR51161.1 GNAT family N-acetyltransferase [Halovenus carboxidivorans]